MLNFGLNENHVEDNTNIRNVINIKMFCRSWVLFSIPYNVVIVRQDEVGMRHWILVT